MNVFLSVYDTDTAKFFTPKHPQIWILVQEWVDLHVYQRF